LKNRGFFAILANGRKEETVIYSEFSANLCKYFTQKWSVLHFGTDHRQLLFFSQGVFFDFSDADIEV